MTRQMIRQFAMQSVGLTEEEMARISSHDAMVCRCDLCWRFTLYINHRKVIEGWEEFRLSRKEAQ